MILIMVEHHQFVQFVILCLINIPSKGLANDQVSMIHGVLDLKGKTARDAMVPMHETFMLGMCSVLLLSVMCTTYAPDQDKVNFDSETMATIIAKGYSRVPVFRNTPHNIQGLLLVKNLIPLNPGLFLEMSSVFITF